MNNDKNDQTNRKKNEINMQSEFLNRFMPMFSIVLFLLAVRYFLNGKMVMGIVWVVFGISFILLPVFSKKKKK